MATTKVELYNGATLVATKTSAPFTSIDWTPVTTGAATLTAKRYEDGVLVATSSVKNYTVNAAAGANNPSELTNIHLWYDATDAATVTADGSNVISTIAAKSGAKTLTSLGSPKYLNSEIQFRETAKQMMRNTEASTVLDPDVDFHAFYIFKSATTTDKILFTNRNAAPDVLSVGIISGNLAVKTLRAAASVSAKSIAFSDTTNYHKLEIKNIASVLTAYLDDVELTGSTAPGHDANGGFIIGNYSAAHSQDFKEIFITSGQMSANERTDMLTYISNKYSL